MRIANSTVAALCLFCAFGAGAKADPAPDIGAAAGIILPSDGDDYSKLVARAAAHDESVDFRALRFAYLQSAARKRDKDEDALRKALLASVNASAPPTDVRDEAIKLLSADYADLHGHKFLRQACAFLHDDSCAAQEHFVEFGLLNSIMKSGDGKTCATGWEVARVKEEYFVTQMAGVTVTEQSLLRGSPSCDLLQGKDENGNAAAYYFRIDAVLKDESAALGLN